MRTRFAGRSEEEIDEAMTELAEFRETVLDNARIRPGETVLDAGTGTGLIALGATERVGADGDVLALDVSIDCLEELRGASTAPNIFYLIGSADVLPLPDASIDVVCTRSVLIYVNDKGEAAREFFRVLRAGGRVSIFEPINRRRRHISEVVEFGALAQEIRSWEEEVDANSDDPMLNFDEGDLERFFAAAGFDAIELDFRRGEAELPADRWLSGIGAPGRRSVLDVWAERFPADQLEELLSIVRTHGSVRLAWPQLYLTAAKT